MSRTVSPFVLRAVTIVQGGGTRSSHLTPDANRVKARFERDRFSMRGLMTALLAFDAAGHNVNHWAGRLAASRRSLDTKTLAKRTGKTTTKTV
jgi:hypothetical protein